MILCFLKKNAFPVLLCLLVAAVLFPVMHNGFVDWDDMQYVVSNGALRGSWLDILTFFPGYYQPVTILTYKLEFVLFGLNPLPYHFTSLLLHLINCVSVFCLFRLLGARSGSAFLGALLFGIHPVNVEPAAWISGRKELLWAMFSFWALIAYLRFLSAGGRRLLAYSVSFFILAVLSKPSAAVFPLIILLADHYRGRAFGQRLLAEKIPYLAVAVTGFLLSSSPSGFLLRAAGEGGSVLSAAGAAVQGALFYAGKFLVPLKLSAVYPPLEPLAAGAGLVLLLPALAAIAGFALLRRRGVGKQPGGEGERPEPWKKAMFGLGFFLAAAIPGLIVSPPADRYAYVPAAGLCFLYGEFVFWLYRSARGAGGRFRAGAVAIIAVAHFLVLGGAAHSRAAVWKDSLTLWGDVLEKSPLEYMAYYGRGNARQTAGQYAGALEDFSRCFELNPAYWKAVANRGRTFAELKKFDEAIADYGRAIKICQDSPQLFLNRGNAYLLSGKTMLAVKDYDSALALAPGMAQAAENRAKAKLRRPAGR